MFIEKRQELLRNALKKVLLMPIESSGDEIGEDNNIIEYPQQDDAIDENGVVVDILEEKKDPIIGQVVIHKVFGEGVILSYNDKYITVQFDTGKKPFIYPDAFKSFLKAKDPDFQEKLINGLALRSDLGK